LVWVAVGQARRDCEKACDDIVLGSGTKPSVYAAHLLGIVRALQATRQQLLPAVPMARPSQFEGRMRAILDAGRSRRGLSRLEKTLAIAGVSVAVLGAAAVEPWAKCPEQRAAFFSRAEIAPIAAFLGIVPVSAGNREETAQPQAAPKRSCPSSAEPAAVPAIYPSNPARNCPEAPLRAENLLEEISDAVEDGGKAGVAPGVAGGVAPGIRGGIEGGVPGGVEGGVRGGVEGFQKASRKEGRSGSSWFSRGKELHDERRYAEAIEAFRRSIDLGYREGTSSYNIACGYARLGRSSEAMEWLQRAMDAGFDVARYIGRDDDLDSLRNLPAFRDLKRTLKSGDAAAAEQDLERLSHRPAACGSSFYETGKRLLSADSYEAAARAFQQSAESGYRVGTSLYNQACARSLADQREEALVLLEKSLLAGFDDVGLLQRDTDLENVRSEKRYNEIVRLAEDLSLSLPAGSWDAFSYIKHRWRKELPRYQEVAARHPQIGRAWSNFGLAQLRTEDYGGAARAFEKALALGYRKPTTMYNLACAHALASEKDRAFDWLFRALNAGFDGSHSLRHDSDLDHIRRDPRFREALEKAEQQKVAEKD
jgi:tetratricopeptide (TPR) repeat protein